MFAISLLLMTVWLTSVLVGFTMGGLIHALALAAVGIVLTSNRSPRRA
jgi:hypothetical protein